MVASRRRNLRLSANGLSWVLSGAAMLAGGLVYVLWRPPTLRMFAWFDALGVGSSVDTLRAAASSLPEHMPGWAIQSAPQALWLFSGSVAMHALWRGESRARRHAWMLAPLLLALLGEAGQRFHLVCGVFDPADVALIAAGFLAAHAVAVSIDRRDEIGVVR